MGGLPLWQVTIIWHTWGDQKGEEDTKRERIHKPASQTWHLLQHAPARDLHKNSKTRDLTTHSIHSMQHIIGKDHYNPKHSHLPFHQKTSAVDDTPDETSSSFSQHPPENILL